ncbi:MAG: metallophosphoesterase [Anaerolineae bacterium]|nr:metallophosphoesterase [Gloeobacterales cyanobacterium ES-bin-313]
MKRGHFLRHMAWTGLGVLWTFDAGAGLFRPRSVGEAAAASLPGLNFVQISDSHIGFHKPANEQVDVTFQAAINAINALKVPPAFVVHTGDLTHLSKPAEFDQVKQLLSGLKVPLYTLPGEHDVIGDRGKLFNDLFAGKDRREGMQSWDHSGVHCVSLTNVLDFAATGQGQIGQPQLDLLAKDLAPLSNETPVVIFSHIPLFDAYPKWGWATSDAKQVNTLLSRFASATVLSGHIHQVLQRTEGRIQFATATSTAFPLPAPGVGEQPSPVVLPEKERRAATGFRSISLMSDRQLKLEEHPLG